jgi:PAS domain S-box-containing protein
MMSRRVYKPKEILAKLRKAEDLIAQGKPVADAIRAIGVTDATYCRWREDYEGLGAFAANSDRLGQADQAATPAARPSGQKRVIEFDRLAEAVPQIVWITGADGKNIYFNKQWEDYTGLTVEQGHGDGWNIPFHPDDRQRAWEAWQRAWQTDGVYSLECRLRGADGTYRWWLIRGSALHDDKGTIINWYGTWTDVEDIKQTEQALERARDEAEAMNQKLQKAYDEIHSLYEKTKALNQFKTQMFANVSHELRTPLTLILAPIENLLSMGLPEQATERLHLAQRNARGLLKQINDLLDVARLEAGKTTVTYHEADLAKFTKHIASSFEIPAKQRLVGFSVITPPSMPAQIDAEKYERILVNLLSNAFKFTPQGGTIRCEVRESPGSSAIIEVGDSGPGVAEAFRESIFEQFFQIPGSTRFGGTGLGLSIVKEFVEIQHGRVTVGQSAAGGALFRIEIPLRAPEGTAVIRRPEIVSAAASFVEASLPPLRYKKDDQVRLLEPADRSSGRKQRQPVVLVVEDNPDMREYICETLGPDAAIVTADNGREGLEKAHAVMPDLIVSDIMMPEMDGDEMFRKLRATRELETIPFILLTAKADEGLRIELLSAGASDYLTKPFMPEELKAKARSLLEGKARESNYRQLMESAQVDVGTVVKASQAVSGELELGKLIETLLRIAVEHAGAERGLLVLFRDNGLWLEAEGVAAGGGVEVTMRKSEVAPADLPESLLRHVIQTRESVILDDAAAPNLFSADGYVQRRRPRSVLCLPLAKQARLAGALYLENGSTAGAFTSNRIAVLEVLASQAAISLENTRLYGDLREREAKIRRLVDSNIVGISIFGLDRRVIEANDAFLGIVGYSRDDFTSAGLSFADLTPPEWAAADERALAELASTGTCNPWEKEFFRKDGSRVRVLLGSATFGEFPHQGVAFVVDLTERKRAEEELAHANRVATMGQLAASIAHEINQPIAAGLINAGTAMRWLDREPPNMEGARQSIDRITADGKRAANIVGRILEFSKKAPARKGDLEINEAILDIMSLSRAAMSEHGVVAKMQLSEKLPPVLGDRVQLQQVMLNLIMNAIEAMSEVREGSRELLINTSEVETGSVLVAVSDSGPGLPHAKPERLFEAFYTTKANGLGMGLSICRSIVEAHGGRLWATPNQPRGAVFCMMLPIRERSFEDSRGVAI